MKIPSFKKTYQNRTVLNFPGLETENGKIYAVIGANGSGKSTFAKILAGIIPADEKTRLPKELSVGYMPQKNYPFRMSTLKNILLGGKDERRAEELMEKLKISHLRDKKAHRLSGGETARMALVRLMMKSYDIIILDEPTSAMDMESSFLSEEMIMQYVKETGCALILITHSLSQAKRIADMILYFHNGELLEYGEKDHILTSPQMEETKNFLEFYGA